VTDTEFAEAKKFWLMFQAKETFKAVHQGCLELVRSGLGKESPLYFPTIAGLICLYGKPFKNNKGVGKLPRDMVPKEQLSLYDQLIVIRDQLYAHSDASETVIAGTLHFGEVRAYVRSRTNATTDWVTDAALWTISRPFSIFRVRSSTSAASDKTPFRSLISGE